MDLISEAIRDVEQTKELCLQGPLNLTDDCLDSRKE